MHDDVVPANDYSAAHQPRSVRVVCSATASTRIVMSPRGAAWQRRS